MIVTPFLLLAAAGMAAAPSPVVKQGVDAWQAGDYPKAVKAWQAPAAAGDADAQFNLAQAYKLGRGVNMDMRQAEAWYRKAAEQGHEQAGAMLGLIMFQNGDRKGAMPWIRKAADAGDPRAQYVAGTAMFNGDEVPKDYPRAYAMMTKAAAAGLPQAQQSLRQMDQFIPTADRQAGLALAKTGARTAAADTPPPVAPRVPVAPRTPVRTTPLPASKAASADAPSPAKPHAKPVAVAAAPAPKPVAKPAAGGGWRVQLGAYADAAKAQGQWTKLSGIAGLRGLTPAYVKAGPVTRLQAGPFASRAAASAACKAASGAGVGCFPVAG